MSKLNQILVMNMIVSNRSTIHLIITLVCTILGIMLSINDLVLFSTIAFIAGIISVVLLCSQLVVVTKETFEWSKGFIDSYASAAEEALDKM